MRTAIRTTLLLAATTLVACGGATEPGADPGTGGGDDTTLGAPADGGLTVPEALQTDVEGPVTVRGLLLDDGASVRLCEISLESYPPQCGGASLAVEGVDVAALDGATTEGAVSWVDQATLTGTTEDGTLVVDDTTQS